MLVYHSDSCVGWCTVDLVSIFAVVVVTVVWSAAVLCAVGIVLFGLHTETLMGCLCAIDMSLWDVLWNYLSVQDRVICFVFLYIYIF